MELRDLWGSEVRPVEGVGRRVEHRPTERRERGSSAALEHEIAFL